MSQAAESPDALSLGHKPSWRERAVLLAALWPLSTMMRPRFHGFERLPATRPLIFVGNHQFLALDTPLLMAELWRRKLLVRPLGDDFLFALEPISAALATLGVVRASPHTADALLARGESILVYPGGAREAAKGAGHAFELEWWDRLGFARLALRTRCPVVPVAAAGVDDCLHVLLESDRYLRGPVARLVDAARVRRDLFPPVFLPRRLPHPAFKLGEPIVIDHFDGHDEESAARRLRSEVAAQLQSELTWLLKANAT